MVANKFNAKFGKLNDCKRDLLKKLRNSNFYVCGGIQSV